MLVSSLALGLTAYEPVFLRFAEPAFFCLERDATRIGTTSPVSQDAAAG